MANTPLPQMPSVAATQAAKSAFNYLYTGPKSAYDTAPKNPLIQGDPARGILYQKAFADLQALAPTAKVVPHPGGK